ncbi:DedA family protein [Patescibacteria group bacterium]|nr:DedA family protein [Patescibacteria group bacterium]
MESIIATVTGAILQIIDSAGYPGIFVLMVSEGSFLPIPSEIILTFSGYLVSQGRFSLFLVAIVGAFGNVVGTLITYAVGRYLGLPFLYRYGKYALITRGEIDRAHRLFTRHGIAIIFVSRLIPGARGYIPIGAGVAQMNIAPFIITVFIGSFFYSLALTYIGVILGENWNIVGAYFRQFDSVIILGVLLIGGWWLWRRIKALRQEHNQQLAINNQQDE